MIFEEETIVVTATFTKKDFSEDPQEPVNVSIYRYVDKNSCEKITESVMTFDDEFSTNEKIIYRADITVGDYGTYLAKVTTSNGAKQEDWFNVVKSKSCD